MISSEKGYIFSVWQEYSGENDRYVSLVGTLSQDGKKWSDPQKLVNPFLYDGVKKVSLFSLACDKKGIPFMAVSTTAGGINILKYEEDSLQKIASIPLSGSGIAPKLFSKKEGGFYLFYTAKVSQEGIGDVLSIFMTQSDNGTIWSTPRHFIEKKGLKQNFLPIYGANNRYEYILFQSLYTGERNSYQLYLKRRALGEKNWDKAKAITLFPEVRKGEEYPFYSFDNQRAHFIVDNESLFLTWERRLGRETPSIYFMSLDLAGEIKQGAERVSSLGYFAASPQITVYKNSLYLMWFDNRRGNQVIMAQKEGPFWRESPLSFSQKGESTYGQWLNFKGNLYSFWEQKWGQRRSISFLAPDKSVLSPIARGTNFRFGHRTGRETVNFKVEFPKDSSGIVGFVSSWGTDPNFDLPLSRESMKFDSKGESFTIPEEGRWYLKLGVEDYAGNWSKVVTYQVDLDQTPPPAVEFTKPSTDLLGALDSNTFSLSWQCKEEHLGGYAYSLKFLGHNYDFEAPLALGSVPRGIRTKVGSLSFRNQENGFWALTVVAVDDVGNRSKPKVLIYKTDKYKPVTYISYVKPQRDEHDRVLLKVVGRGFSEGGDIDTLYIDEDKKAPWDYEISKEQLKEISDRLIETKGVDIVKAGHYFIGVKHPSRGIKFSRSALTLDSSGMVHYGDFSYKPKSQWKKAPIKDHIWNISQFIFLFSIFFIVFLMALSIFKIIKILEENRRIMKMGQAIIEGKLIRKKDIKEYQNSMKSKGMGLRFKFSMWILSLILLVILLISLFLGNFMIKTQKESLTNGLSQQTNLLLNTLATGARSYLPSQDSLELGLLPQTIKAMDDAISTTITGQGVKDPETYNYIWGSNKKNLEFNPGETVLNDSITKRIEELEIQLNREAFDIVGQRSRELDELTEQAVSLAIKGDQRSLDQLSSIQESIKFLENQINQELRTLSLKVYSSPHFDISTLGTKGDIYTFYKPILYRNKSQETYFRGIVRLEVSIESILLRLDKVRNNIIKITLIISLISLLLGFIGAILLSRAMIIPIQSLLKGVEKITFTQDKSRLNNYEINLKTKDELALLANRFNLMTKGLIKAAASDKELMIGKEIQKKFIPLKSAKDNMDRKLSTGSLENENVNFFGYYEGAKGVSGDYFDFRPLDNEHFAIIKCDISGKGIPASLIMVEVATIFVNYFRNINIKRDGIHLDDLVYNLNDLLEEVGFKGRFAALIIAVLNTKTGKIYMCNAGDKLVHHYNKSGKKMEIQTLNEVPAAGVFPSFMLEGDRGYQQIPHTMKKGDIIYLFTDGIEEAQRHFRDDNFQVIDCDGQCSGTGVAEGEIETHKKGSNFEEFGIPRVHGVIEACLHRGVFVLEKHHDPLSNRSLTFDFSQGEASLEESVLALIAVERVYRLNPDPNAGPADRIHIDNQVDNFLKRYFKEYREYFKHSIPDEVNPEYTYYSHLKEDEQFDDLTILGIQNK